VGRNIYVGGLPYRLPTSSYRKSFQRTEAWSRRYFCEEKAMRERKVIKTTLGELIVAVTTRLRRSFGTRRRPTRWCPVACRISSPTIAWAFTKRHGEGTQAISLKHLLRGKRASGSIGENVASRSVGNFAVGATGFAGRRGKAWRAGSSKH
jgi:hypothetical protein